jgi:hypothetical protein
MKITAAIIADANTRMAAIATDETVGDGSARLARMAEVWEPIAGAAASIPIPREASNVRERMGKAFVGMNEEGGVIAWGEPEPMPGTDRTWRPLIILGPGRPGSAPRT